MEFDGASAEAWQRWIGMPYGNTMRQSRRTGWGKSMEGYVLVVDDEPDAREILTDIIHALGFKTRSACDGQEALQMIQAEPPLLVMLDLMMPNLGGFGVLARLRSVPATRYIPVIVVTAYGREQIDMLMLPGVTEVIQKGQFSVESVTALITDNLEPSGSNGAGQDNGAVNKAVS